jgi:hypothetical protein
MRGTREDEEGCRLARDEAVLGAEPVQTEARIERPQNPGVVVRVDSTDHDRLGAGVEQGASAHERIREAGVPLTNHDRTSAIERDSAPFSERTDEVTFEARIVVGPAPLGDTDHER